MITSTTELRIKKVQINTIITCCQSDKELENVAQWNKAAARIAVFGQVTPFTVYGYRFLQTKNKVPGLREALAKYVINLQEGGILAIASPLILINPDQVEFFSYIDKVDMGRSWAASATQDGISRLFVISASVLPHIMRDLPDTIPFSGDEWEIWMHNWLSKYMLKHRYFNADQFGLIRVKPAIPADAPNLATEPKSISFGIDGKAVEQKADNNALGIYLIKEPKTEPIKVEQKSSGLEAALSDIVPMVEKKKPGRPKKNK